MIAFSAIEIINLVLVILPVETTPLVCHFGFQSDELGNTGLQGFPLWQTKRDTRATWDALLRSGRVKVLAQVDAREPSLDGHKQISPDVNFSVHPTLFNEIDHAFVHLIHSETKRRKKFRR